MARLVSQVTEPMLGLGFTSVNEPPGGVGPGWKTAVATIDGSRPLTVAVSADRASGRALAARIFRIAPERVDDADVDDGLCELANVAAGLLKSALREDHALGLPAIRDGVVVEPGAGGGFQHVLRAVGMNVVLVVARPVS